MFRNFFNEFKKFAMRGNVIDMAVGIIIGAAFGKIVDSLVKDYAIEQGAVRKSDSPLFYGFKWKQKLRLK